MKITHTKRILSILSALVLTLSLLPAAVADGGVLLTIIHVNDRHGRTGADAAIPKLGITGNVLILDAGDALHGQTPINLSQGAVMVDVMNAVGYSAMVPGNHDFNYGIDRLLELSGMMDFPLLSANVRVAETGELLFQPYEVFEMDGITAGVFGITTPETVTSSDPRNVASLQFDDPAETAEAMVAALQDEGCDIIIALVHMGRDDSSEPEDRSDAVAAIPGIDVVIDGHSHDALDAGVLVGDTLIAQTGEHGKNIGVVEITETGKTARLIEVTDDLEVDEDILAAIEAAEASIAHITETVVGETPVPLDGERGHVRTGETNLANLVTDSMRHATGAGVSFVTGGNIRTSIEPGDITMGQVLTVLPFANLLVTVELTGAELLGVLEHGVEKYPEEAGQHIQVSGVTFSYDPDAEPGERVHNATVGDAPLALQETYTVATSEFLAFGGDGYDLSGQSLVYYGGDAEALAQYLATAPEILAEAEGRAAAKPRFDDVDKNAWYFPAVSHAAAMGYFPSGGSFKPHDPVTADEMLKLLNGDKTSVGGDGPLTRENLAVMLMDLLPNLAQSGDEPDYADAALIDETCLDAVHYAYKTGLMTGGGTHFNPKGVVTRAQAAAALVKGREAFMRLDRQSAIAQSAFDFFLEVSKIPRGSGNPREISDWLKSFGEQRGFETIQDEVLNVFIKKPASKGREAEEPVILQAHMDMVCEKNEGVPHDFLKDPILPVIEDGWVTANGTTLGADNGVGMAMILAILDAPDLSHPPIEALITTEEETTTEGALMFDTTLFTASRLINLDSEGEGVFTVSSAAAGSATITIPIKEEPVQDTQKTYKLTIKGLTGGHSGVDIHKGLANANLLMAKLLTKLSIVNCQLSIVQGGSAQNAIPREAGAVISFAEADLEDVQSVLDETEAAFKAAYPDDTGLTVILEETETAELAFSAGSLQTVLDALLQLPAGVLKMSAGIEGLVQTSNNVGVVRTEGDSVIITCFARSSEPDEQLGTLGSIEALAESLGADVKIVNDMPAWPYRPHSPLRDTMAAVYKEMFGSEPLIEAIHAGLECGIFTRGMEKCDIISIGPDIHGAHSPDERLSAASFNRTADFVVRVLERL